MEQRNDLVVCEGLTKIYGSIRALDSLSLTLERGRFIGLLGPNGSGKRQRSSCLTACCSRPAARC